MEDFTANELEMMAEAISDLIEKLEDAVFDGDASYKPHLRDLYSANSKIAKLQEEIILA